jgi:amino acid transporter
MVVAMAQEKFKRQLGWFAVVRLICGDTIGTGIFVITGLMAETLSPPNGGR